MALSITQSEAPGTIEAHTVQQNPSAYMPRHAMDSGHHIIGDYVCPMSLALGSASFAKNLCVYQAA